MSDHTTKECPFCKEQMKAEASRCPHCGESLGQYLSVPGARPGSMKEDLPRPRGWSSAAAYPFQFILWLLQWGELFFESIIDKGKRLALFDVLEYATRIAIIVTLVFWFAEAKERRLERYSRAMQVVEFARSTSGGGQPASDALEVLHSAGFELSNYDLQDIYLPALDLNGADLSDANLQGADLFRASLRSTDLSGANLRDVDLRGADLGDANLSTANLSGAIYDDETVWPEMFDTMASGAIGIGPGADLGGIDLDSAFLAQADLRGADLSAADLRNTDLREANLNGAVLIDANLRDANLHNANLSGTNLNGVNLRGAYLSTANLSGADLREAVYDADTNWPERFDYQAAGAVRVDGPDDPSNHAR